MLKRKPCCYHISQTGDDHIMNKEEFLNELATMLEENTLVGNEVLEDLPSWDSLATISFIALVDENFNFIVSGDSLSKVKTVDGLLDLVKNHFTVD